MIPLSLYDKCRHIRAFQYGRVLVIMPCIFLLIYQAIYLTNGYLQFETLFDIHLEAADENDWPSVTVCRSLYDNRYPFVDVERLDKETKWEDDFDVWVRRQQRDPSVVIPSYSIYDKLDALYTKKLTLGDYFRMTNDDSKIILSSQIGGHNWTLSNYSETLHSSYPWGHCLTFFSRLYKNENSTDVLGELLERSKDEAALVEVTVLENEDKRVEEFKETVFVMIHSRVSLYDFEKNAAEMKNLEFGKRYKTFVNEEITDRQPPPYDNMCHWYDESANLLEKADRQGNEFNTEEGLSQAHCYFECWKQQVRLKCNCSFGGDLHVDEDLSERDTKICNDTDDVNTFDFKEAGIDFRLSSCRCRHSCHEIVYKHNVIELNTKASEEFERDMAEFEDKIGLNSKAKQAPPVVMKVEGRDVPVIRMSFAWSHGDHLHKYTPKMQFIDFLSRDWAASAVYGSESRFWAFMTASGDPPTTSDGDGRRFHKINNKILLGT